MHLSPFWNKVKIMKKKSVGIITIAKVNNYGAELQAFALQKKIQELGFDAEIIDYLYYSNPDFKKERASNPVYSKSFPLVKRLKSWFFPKIEWIKAKRYSEQSKIRNERFRDFHTRNTKFSTQYKSYSALYSSVPKYDVYCVGSDQVWNPFSYTSLDPYFLTFVSPKKVRFSYASSFGVSTIPEYAKEYFRNRISGLDYISVREKTGVNIVKELTNRDSINVVDPTLLLETSTWSSISSDVCVPNEKYILLYVLKEDPSIEQIAQSLSKERGLPIIRICRNSYRQDPKKSPIINIMDAGPAEFLGLIKHAEIVLTNSFHGTVFSILFHKDFYTIISKGKNTNSRQIDLLNNLNLDRIRYSQEAFSIGNNIDWTKVDSKLTELRATSIDFLNTAINCEK